METRFVNGYCGEILFTANGYFEKQESSSTSNLAVYFFHFEDRIPCSSAEGLVGIDSFDRYPPPFVEQLLKMKDNLFRVAESNPGQAFLGSNSASEVQWCNKKAVITLELDSDVDVPSSHIINLLSVSVIDLKVFHSNSTHRFFAFREEGTLISLMAKIRLWYSRQFVLKKDLHSIVSGCIETKVVERSNDKILGQLVCNMTVCIAKSLEILTAPDLRSLKVASCYGLILDYLQPIQLYKYSMNFETGERSLVSKLSRQKFSSISHEVINRSITYMLKTVFPHLQS